MSGGQRRTLLRIVVAAVLFAALLIAEKTGALDRIGVSWAPFALYLVPYLLVGFDVILKACRNIAHGQVFDENLLMLIASAAAFAIGEYEEAVAVMLFYQVGELFQSVAVGRSRRSIAAMMDIAPEYANVEQGGELAQVDPEDVEIGTVIVIRPGERVPLDGVVLEGESYLDTAALTGESVPRRVGPGSEIISGCVNGSETLKVRTTKTYENSTVARILELVENAAEKKSKTEGFITRFARYYTPVVTVAAVLLAVVPPLLFAQPWDAWIRRACVFLVVSCPCALVISVPLGFFGGIGAASKLGVLIKGSNYLELTANPDVVAFDKTGTLTRGEFTVTEILPTNADRDTLLELAAHGEGYSKHPIAASIRAAYGKPLNMDRVGETEEIAGHGVRAVIDGREVLLGNFALMRRAGVSCEKAESAGAVVYAASEGEFLGAITISDTVKPEAKEAIGDLRGLGVGKTVMLTGDRKEAAAAVARELGIDETHAELLPADKVTRVEELTQRGTVLFVGDGMNDAPVLRRADVGVAMGSMGSDAAIEAADIVIMDDDVRKLAAAVKIAGKTMRIVRENIIFALSVKAIILLLGAFGIATMWLAVFGDVGVAVLAILNAMRALRLGKKKAT